MAYNHAEAFCHMKYRNKQTGEILWIYNTRDGVTPFIVFINGVEHTHVEWHDDRQEINYQPSAGQYVFTTITAERAEEVIRKRIAAAPQYVGDRDPEEIVKSFVTNCLEQGDPMLCIVADGKYIPANG